MSERYHFDDRFEFGDGGEPVAIHLLDDSLVRLTNAAHEAGRQEAQEWQPIESAPKDGTPVLIWEPNAVDMAYWWKDHGWHYAGNSSVPCAPTHWMPLPDPPANPDPTKESE